MISVSNHNQFNAVATYLRRVIDAKWTVYFEGQGLTLEGQGCLLIEKHDRFVLKITPVNDTMYKYKLYIRLDGMKIVIAVLVCSQFEFSYKMPDYDKYLNNDMKQQLKYFAIGFYKELINIHVASIDSCFQDISERKALIAMYSLKLQNPQPGCNYSIIRKFLPRWKEGIDYTIRRMGAHRNDIHCLEAKIELLELANN